MPLNINFVQILLHALNFVILAGVLTLLVYNPVSKFLNARKERISDEYEKSKMEAQNIDKMKEECEQMLIKAQNDAKEIRIRAENDAAKIASTTIEEANEKASNIITSAEKEAEDRKEHVLEAAQTEIGEIIISAAQKLLVDTASEERSSELYDAFIKTMQDRDK